MEKINREKIEEPFASDNIYDFYELESISNVEIKNNLDNTAKYFDDVGGFLLSELNRKKRKQEQEKTKLIQYIIKKSKEYNETDFEYLMQYSFDDIRKKHQELKIKNAGIFKKILEFIYKT